MHSNHPGTIVSSTTNLAVVELNSDRSIDTSFGTNGNATIPLVSGTSTYTIDDADDIAVQSNGQIVVLATASLTGSPDDFVVARLDANGALDSSFGSSGLEFFNFATGFATRQYDTAALAIAPNSEIIVVVGNAVAGTSSMTTSGNLTNIAPGSGIIKSGAAVLDNGSVLSEYVSPTVTSARVAHHAARVRARRA